MDSMDSMVDWSMMNSMDGMVDWSMMNNSMMHRGMDSMMHRGMMHYRCMHCMMHSSWGMSNDRTTGKSCEGNSWFSRCKRGEGSHNENLSKDNI